MPCAWRRKSCTWGLTGGIFSCAWAANAPTTQAQEQSWDYLKRRLREMGLADADGGVLRTKADCLRVCVDGPIAVVYPEGTWLSGLLG